MDTEYSMDQHVRQDEQESALKDYETGIPALLPAQVRQVELLAHLASYSELLVAVSGPEGSGKTTLAQALAAHREEPEEALCLTAGPTLGLPAVLAAIASHWNMPRLADDLVAAREAVRSEAEQRLAEGASLLIIIDDAELLDAETLNEISHFALLAPQAISFALFGSDNYEAGFRETPAHAPLHVMALEPLSLNDASRLLQQVFAPGQALALSQDDILLIYQQSGGWPGILLQQAENYLLNSSAGRAASAAADHSEASGSRFPLPHLLAIAAVAAALLMSYFYSGTEDAATESTETVTTLTFPPQNAEPEPVQELAPPVVAVVPEATSETAPEVAQAEEPDYNYEAAEPQLSRQQKPAETVITEPPPAAPAVAEKTVPAAEPQRSKAERVLLAAAADSFVVQLFASYQADSAEHFRQQWADKVSGSLYQYETEYKSRPWHVVVAGVFASRAEAQAAVNALPVELRRQSPWIRDVTAVQKVLR